MGIKNKYNVLEVKTLAVPLVITILILIIFENIMIVSVKNHYYNHIKEDSLNFANNYSHSLKKVKEAQEIVNTLLEEKLLVASKTITLYEGKYSNKLLDEMARNLKIDVIYYFNSLGEIIYSNDEKYIGWKSYEGHPVYDFMKSDNIGFVEDIRKDSEYGIYYKYGYFKAPDGNFVQIGVLAENIQDFIDGFKVQDFLDELSGSGLALQVCFIDNDFNVIGSTDKNIIGTQVINQKVRQEILKNNEYNAVGNLYGENVYEIYAPIYYKEQKIGTLHVAHPLKETERLVKWVNVASLIGMSVIIASLIYVLVSIYNKNRQLIKLVYYDSLTDLPNNEYLMEHLTETIKGYKEIKKAILLINCSNFRTINLVSGYQYGDKVLKEISIRLKRILNPQNMLYRFGADRFIIYVENYNTKNDLIILSNKISEEFENPVIGNKHVEIQIGIVEINDNYEGPDQVLKDVSIALNHINGNDCDYAFFNEDMENKLKREETIERELVMAISNEDTNKIYLEYQPMVDLISDQIIGFEALARMKSEELGFVSPVEFIDVAERKHLIVPLGNFILKTACNFIQKLNDEGFSDIKVAVNISGIQLLRDDFNKTVKRTLYKTGIKGSSLELEITESILVENFNLINEKLKELREIGVKISLDDFGTGYSSFARLRELNVDFVKIDKHFINRITAKKHNDLITGDIISMAHKIGLTVVAEGVEFAVQKEYLIEHGCEVMQGYLFSRPLPEEKAIKILKDSLGIAQLEWS